MQTSKPSLTSYILLITAALIWGFAFVAQKEGTAYFGVFTFNFIRFALGTLTLLPILWWVRKKEKVQLTFKLFTAGCVCGIFLCTGAYLQQAGLTYTTAGNSGIITGLYVILVPILGLFFKKRSNINLWLGAVLALIGMYFLSVKEGFQVSKGDFIIFVSAFVWAGHVLAVSHFAPKFNGFMIAGIQFAFSALFSGIGMLIFEHPVISLVTQAYIPLLYTGVLSIGGAFTLQVIAQKNVHPSMASVILSLESLFAAIGGWWILHEQMNAREIFGCCIMIFGIIVAQMDFIKLKDKVFSK